MKKLRCSFDTNVVSGLAQLHQAIKDGYDFDHAYSYIKSNQPDYFSYTPDQYRRLCKLYKYLGEDTIKPFVSPIVLTELFHKNIPMEVKEQFTNFLEEYNFFVINTKDFDFDKLVSKYMERVDDRACFKPKSKNDATIFAHSSFAGCIFVTNNTEDFTKGKRDALMMQRNAEFYRENHLEQNPDVHEDFCKTRAYTTYHFVEDYYPRAVKMAKAQEDFEQ